MLWWLNHYAFFDMAALLLVIWAYGLFQWLKIGESRADLPRRERAAGYFSAVKRSFIRGKVQLACLTNSTPYVRTGPVLSSIAFGGEVSTPWLLKQKFRT